jgi:hypothetical protein
MKKRELLVRFLASVNQIDETLCSDLPDNDVKLLLTAVIVAHQSDEPLNVSQAMHIRRIGSPAKNHRKINDLLAAGMIEMAHFGGNRRTKFLIPTASAMAVFDTINVAFLEVCKLHQTATAQEAVTA